MSAQTTEQPRISPDSAPVRSVTLRSIVLGICLTIAVSLLANWVRWVLAGSFMSYSHMPMANMILYLLLLLLLTPMAKVMGKGQAAVIIVGLLLLINPDIEIISTVGAVLMCIGYIPLGIRELRGELEPALVLTT